MSDFLKGYFTACKGDFRVSPFSALSEQTTEFYSGYDKAVLDGKHPAWAENSELSGMVKGLEA